MTKYEWAVTRQVRWLILLLLVILIAIPVIYEAVNPSPAREAWRATMKFACERKSPACPMWRRVLANVGIVTW